MYVASTWARFTILTLALCAVPSIARAQCPAIDPNDWNYDDAGLQCRLDIGGTITLVPGNPGYIVNDGLFLRVNGTRLVSSGAPGQTAIIIAGPNLHAWMLITPPYPVHDVEISYITFDGRVDTPGGRLDRYCKAPNNTPGNIAIWGDRTYVHNSESKAALCGSGLLAFGNSIRLIGNYVAYNGRDRFSGEAEHPWADGITSLTCPNGEIAYNVLVDNTDVDIVTGGGNCHVHDNVIWHGGKYAFAGIHVGYFDNGGGNHSGAVFENNSIESAVHGKLGMGIAVGFHPWADNVAVNNPTVRNNNIIGGAMVNLLVDGAFNVSVYGNSIGAPSSVGGYAGPGTCYLGTGLSFTYGHASGSLQPGAVGFFYDNETC
jgi:hypothetical protein